MSTPASNRLADAFGVTAASRRGVVAAMRRKPSDDRSCYWFQLALAAGIAIFGLELDSPGVVIGAMLIAPLMSPIVELGMSLTLGDGVLLVRSFTRIVLSIVAVVLLAAMTAIVLPFRAASPEILARTAPTMLDLCIAVLCALVAAYTTVRVSSSAASTAAGTSIGISLVPPLCVVGFGLGVGNMPVATGAMLLFTANFCAILLFAGLFFAAVGFHSLPRTAEDEDTDFFFQRAPFRRAAAVIEAGLHSRWRTVWRVGMPLALFASVSVPLTQALRQVAWQVRTRAAVNEVIAAEPSLRDAISVTSVVEPGALIVRGVIIGDAEAALTAERRVASALAKRSGGVTPLVHVRAVPPEEARSQREAIIEAAEPSLSESLKRVSTDLQPLVAETWRRDALAGQLVATDWQGDGRSVVIRIVHDGPALPGDARSALERTLSAQLGLPATVRAMGLAPVEAARDADLPVWWDRTQAMLAALDMLAAGWKACIEVPTVRSRSPLYPRITSALADHQTALGPARLVTLRGRAWRARVMAGDCQP